MLYPFPRRSRFREDRKGNFAVMTALLVPVLIAAAGGAVDISHAMLDKTTAQDLLDAGMLSAATKPDLESQRAEVETFLAALTQKDQRLTKEKIDANLSLATDEDGNLIGHLSIPFQTTFLGIVGLNTFDIGVTSGVAIAHGAATAAGQPCIWVLGNESPGMRVNSGANIHSEKCEIHVASTTSQSFIMNGDATIDTAKFCLRGTQYLWNAGRITNFEKGCSTAPDPFAGNLVEPTVPSTCTTSGAQDGSNQTLQPGLHCNVNFNSSSSTLKLTFAPGLHIIKGVMTVPKDAVVVANGVTFYFPDTNSKIQFSDGLTVTASAPTSGPYKDVLMFEKASSRVAKGTDVAFVFNGSKGETLNGIIYLPNRDVTYNSTSNSTSNIALVVKTLIVNPVNWSFEPYAGAGGSRTAGNGSGPRLIR